MGELLECSIVFDQQCLSRRHNFSALPAISVVQSDSSVAVWNSQLKLWGLLGANDTATDDGSATFATDIAPSLLGGVALHELTHPMGRVPYGTQPDVFDLFRFAGSGVYLFSNGDLPLRNSSGSS
ncbi:MULTISPECIES: hypothetical protein [unclassified Bradyrhizobium]|uniref:hypothetical protein n=1 Tax=unclassified Bradyrhizobium TaxID=2631580 RepID=UPI00291653F3|nr:MULTISPECIES: hypothetical protein [unclassified Bradyrhizobium]